MKKHILLLCICCTFLLACNLTLAKPMPTVQGTLQTIIVKPGQDFFLLAQQYDVGYDALINANQGVDPDHPITGTVLVIPTRHIVPPEAEKGIVINLAEKRLYYFDKTSQKLYTYPIGIGRESTHSPEGQLQIIEKRYLPHWNVPESIAKLMASQGIILPAIVPPGPTNPLGEYAMRLSNPSYLLHGTNWSKGIGRPTTNGCFSLYPNDIKALYAVTKLHTKVTIINRPIKTITLGDTPYIEIHPPLYSDDQPVFDKETASLVDTHQSSITRQTIQWASHIGNGLTQPLTRLTNIHTKEHA